MKDVFVLDDVKKVVIDTGSFDLTIKATNRDDVSVEYSEEISEDINIGFENGELIITATRFMKTFPFFKLNSGMISEVSVDIEVPNHQYQNFTIKSIAGEVDVEGIAADIFKVNAKAGDYNFKNIRTTEIDLQVGAGDIDFRDVELGEVELSVNAGDISFEQCKVTSCKGSILAGDVSFDDCAIDKNQVNVKTTAGDIRIN